MLDKRWVLGVTSLFLFVTLIPNLFGLMVAGDRYYTGYDVNPDDMCVYNAWMEQARRGHFFFDNRFTTEPQPRLTVHLLFYLLGNVSRFTSLEHPVVFHLALIVFGFLFLMAAWRLICRCSEDELQRRTMFVLLLVGAGVGWLMRSSAGTTGPTDLWQPEGFVFPSLMTNALFAASLWLMVEVWHAILDARASWKAVPRGFVAMLVLANIHTYDVLTIGLVAIGFAACLLAARLLSGPWLVRALAIGAGAAPPAIWLSYVFKNDPVFAARAATLTFSPDLWQYVLGYLPLLVFAVFGVRSSLKERSVLAWAPLVLLAILIPVKGWLNVEPSLQTALGFAAVYLGLIGGATAIAKRIEKPEVILLIVWAVLALWVPYFPGLFQRKLTMGAEIPLALLAGMGLSHLFAKRRVAITAVAAVAAISNVLWLQGSIQRIGSNEATTLIHPVFLPRDQIDAIGWLRNHAAEDAAVLDLTFHANYIPALAGQRTYASHWSETPDFTPKFTEVNWDIYGALGPSRLSPEERLAHVRELGMDYVVWYKEDGLTNFSSLGTVVFERPNLAIVKVEK